jgi:hypothetical protein
MHTTPSVALVFVLEIQHVETNIDCRCCIWGSQIRDCEGYRALHLSRIHGCAFHLFIAGFLLGLLFYSEDGGNNFLQKVCWTSNEQHDIKTQNVILFGENFIGDRSLYFVFVTTKVILHFILTVPPLNERRKKSHDVVFAPVAVSTNDSFQTHREKPFPATSARFV